MASGDDHVGGGFSPSSSGRNRGRDGGDARFTCVGSGGLWRKRRAKTRLGAGLVHHNEHNDSTTSTTGPALRRRAQRLSVQGGMARSRPTHAAVVSFVLSPPSLPSASLPAPPPPGRSGSSGAFWTCPARPARTPSMPGSRPRPAGLAGVSNARAAVSATAPSAAPHSAMRRSGSCRVPSRWTMRSAACRSSLSVWPDRQKAGGSLRRPPRYCR